MQTQQTTVFNKNNKTKTTPVPVDKLKTFYHLFGLKPKPYKYFQYREYSQVESKTTYGAYSAESIIKLIRAVQNNSKDFLEILAINTTISKQTKKDFIVDKVLREHSMVSFGDIVNELKRISQNAEETQSARPFLQLTLSLISKAKHLLYKHCETVVMVLGECLNFYIRHQKDQNSGKDIFSIVIGLDNICISFCSSNQFCENILQEMMSFLKQACSCLNTKEHQFYTENIVMSDNNIIDVSQIPQQFLNLFSLKQQNLQSYLKQRDLPESYYSSLVVNTLIKYSEDIFLLIESTIVFLTNLVLEKKQLKNIAFNKEFISMRHPTQQKKPLKQPTFMNLYCQHFQGLPYELYLNGQKCPICSKPIIIDQQKSYQRNRNIFQNLLSQNYINPNSHDIVYYFRDKIFTLAAASNNPKFSSYPHFAQFIKISNHIRDRPDVLMILNTEKISLYNKLWGKKKLFRKEQLVTVPVRGKYCRHMQFFDLLRVYQKYITKAQGETSFDCFLCMQPIEYEDEVMYLHQMKLLIDQAKHQFYLELESSSNNENGEDNACTNLELNCYIQIDHTNQKVEVCCQMQKGYMKKAYELNIYETLMDPLMKSKNNRDQTKSSKSCSSTEKIKEEEKFEYLPEFTRYFYGH